MTGKKIKNTPRLSRSLIQGVCLGLAIAALASVPAAADEGAASPAAAEVGVPLPAAHAVAAPSSKRADFDGAQAPADVRRLADWIVASKDNQGVAFVIVEKPQAVVFVFDAKGKILGKAPCLVGAQRGADSVP